jgi:uncharacterized protein (DUF2267 family)
MSTADLRTFVKDVHTSGWFASQDDAVKIIRATFRTLGECLPSAFANGLASEMPLALARSLRNDTSKPKLRLTVAEFVSHVALRGHVGILIAREYAVIVMTALALALPDASLARLRDELPEEYGRSLLGQLPTGIAYQHQIDYVMDELRGEMSASHGLPRCQPMRFTATSPSGRQSKRLLPQGSPIVLPFKGQRERQEGIRR